MDDAIDKIFEGRGETLDPNEVAEIFRKSKQSVYAWLRDGTIRGYKLGSSWIIVRDELKEQLRAGANGGPGLTELPEGPER